MADDGDLMFEITAAKAPLNEVATKTRILNPDGSITKGDAPHVTFWLYKVLRCLNIPEPVALLLLEWNARQDVMMLHGVPAPGLDLRLRHPRWYGESRGLDATIVPGQRASLLFDTDKIKAPEGSALGLAENIEEQARFIREEVLPRAFRDVTLIVRASASTGFDSRTISLHIYVLFDRLIPLATLYRYVRACGRRASASIRQSCCRGNRSTARDPFSEALLTPCLCPAASSCCLASCLMRTISTGSNSKGH
jgi:hypothetical protein